MNTLFALHALHAIDAFSSISFALQAGEPVASAPGPVAQLLSDPLAVLAILGGLATVALNLWLFRLASDNSSPPQDEEIGGPAPPRSRAAILFAPLALQEEGLTFAEVIREIPTDAASLFVYALLAASVTFVWAANRPKRGR